MVVPARRADKQFRSIVLSDDRAQVFTRFGTHQRIFGIRYVDWVGTDQRIKIVCANYLPNRAIDKLDFHFVFHPTLDDLRRKRRVNQSLTVTSNVVPNYLPSLRVLRQAMPVKPHALKSQFAFNERGYPVFTRTNIADAIRLPHACHRTGTN